MIEIKPCPFCGGEVDIHDTLVDNSVDENEVSNKIYYVYCLDCGAILGPNCPDGRSLGQAAEEWNTATYYKSSSEANLLPCPFCSGQARIIPTTAGRYIGEGIYELEESCAASCVDCDAIMGFSLKEAKTFEQAVSAWNTRFYERNQVKNF